MKPAPAVPRRSPFATPAVLVTVGLLALLGLAWGFTAWRTAVAAGEARGRLLAAVDTALGQQPVDGSALSRLVADLQQLPDHETARDVLGAMARIELARERPERAQALFGPVASQPGATPAEQGLGARILLRLQEVGTADAAAAGGMLQQALEMAEAAYRDSRSPGDLLRAWQAAERAGLHERSAAFARQLAADHADSGEAKFVAVAMAFQPELGAEAVQAAMAGCASPPVEGLAMRAFAQLQAGDVGAAVATVEDALVRAAGVGVVRWAAAVVFHACVLGSAAGSADRAGWVTRRDAQLAWVTSQPGIGEDRRKQAAGMRDVR